MPNVKVRITSESDEQMEGGAETLASSKDLDKTRMASTSLFVNAVSGNVKQAIRYGLSNVGNFTGDYIRQNEINQALEIFDSASTIAMGALSAGWAGAVVATASIAVKAGFGAYSRYKQYEAESLSSSLMRERSGNALFDEARGTEN